VLLFVEKTLAEQNNVELVQVAEEAAIVEDFQSKYLEHTTLAQSVFAESSINPHAQFLTKLKAEDIPILEVLSAQPLLQEYAVESTPTYGIKVGGAGRLSQKALGGLLPMGKGQNISSYYINTTATSWVDTQNVADSSIWGRPGTAKVHQAYALSEITMTLQCGLFDPTTYALSNVTVVFVPRSKFCDFPWDVLLNSSVLRFVHLVVLRVSLVGVGTPIEGGRRVSWCHTYPRTLASLPVPRDIMNRKEELSIIGAKLRALAGKIARRWETVSEELSKSTKKPLALQGVDFSNWQSDIGEEVDFRLAQQGQMWTLKPYTEKDQQTLLSIQGSYELLNVVKYLLEEREEEELSARDFQNLLVPDHPEPISNLLDTARDSNSADIREFKQLFKQADDIIADAYGLSDDQWKYVQTRLAGRPFDVLEPRWAWKSVEMREIQEYDVDRFA